MEIDRFIAEHIRDLIENSLEEKGGKNETEHKYI